MEDMVMAKTCFYCKKLRSIEEFDYASPDAPADRKRHCRDCEIIINTRRKERAKFKQQDKRLKRTFGIGLAEYYEILKKQGNGCAICGTKKPSKGRIMLSVDHDHVSGRIRGVLCSQCNAALGLFRDRILFLQRAIKYLED